MIQRPAFIKTPLSISYPRLLPFAMAVRQQERRIEDLLLRPRFAAQRSTQAPKHRVARHQSVLLRKLGSTGQQLQRNKVASLKVVVQQLDGLCIRPGETFSFWRSVGKPSRKRGFLPGMQLHRGEVGMGFGGGICQATNLLFWLALHSELTVAERHHHSFDVFPDDNRAQPFGSGATVLYNYRDFRLFNGTNATFRLSLSLGRTHLHGELQSDTPCRAAFQVFERNHRFERREGQWFRCNELWRRADHVASGGGTFGEEFLFANNAEVKYDPVATGAAREGVVRPGDSVATLPDLRESPPDDRGARGRARPIPNAAA